MPVADAREFYVSSNGDRWEVGRDDAGHLQIVHRPNAPSGGKASVMDVGTFLATRHPGSEHAALLDLLRTGKLDAATPAEVHDEPSG